MTAAIAERTRTPVVTVQIYTKAMVSRGMVRGLLSYTLAERWNAASTATFTVRSDDRRVADLRTPGCRAIMRYFADQDDANPTLAVSGTVTEEQGSPQTGKVTAVSFTIEDDWVDVMQNTLGWVRPAQPITNQGAEAAYYRSTGAAETVAKDIIGANCGRAGKALTVPATAGRGSSITVQIRMHPLVDRLLPAVDDAGIRIRVLQVGTARQLLVEERTTYPEVLSDRDGIVTEGAYTVTAPTVTRLICGASGKQEARIFRLKINTALEAEWGFIREEFLDCRDIKYPSGTFEADVTARANDRFAETGPTSGCNAKLQESARFWVGGRIKLGTQVQIQLGDGPTVTDLVREIQVSSTSDGLSVQPLVGLWDESKDRKLYDLIAAGNKKSRDLGVE